jgi:hypothetical protein
MKTLLLFILLNGPLVLTVILPVIFPAVTWAESETCDRFSFAVSGSRLTELPVTVLRGGMSPVFEIADQTYSYDTASHCMSEAGVKRVDCEKPLKIMSGKKTLAVIEGVGVVTIALTNEKGLRDFSQPYYQVSVERERLNPSRPHFILQAMSADQKTLGRIDGIEGMTAPELTSFKGKLASAHRLIDLHAKSVVYANCRKLAVLRYDDSQLGLSPERNVASHGAPVTTLKMGSLSSASVAAPSLVPSALQPTSPSMMPLNPAKAQPSR